LFCPTNKKEGFLLVDQIWLDKINEIIVDRDIFSECASENINPKLAFF